jgi:hypothetical protein
VSEDVQLTEEERRIFAEIERFERDHRSSSRRDGWVLRNDRWAWAAVVLGTTIFFVGLAARLPFVPFMGFVIVLTGATRLSTRIPWRGWLPRLRDLTQVVDSRSRNDVDSG